MGPLTVCCGWVLVADVLQCTCLAPVVRGAIGARVVAEVQSFLCKHAALATQQRGVNFARALLRWLHEGPVVVERSMVAIASAMAEFTPECGALDDSDLVTLYRLCVTHFPG